MGGFSWWHWAIVLVVVVLIFGTKKLANVGNDLGKAVKGFKQGMKEATADDEKSDDAADVAKPKLTGETIDVEVTKETSDTKAKV